MKPLKPILLLLLLTALLGCEKGLFHKKEAAAPKEDVQKEETQKDGFLIDGVLKNYAGLDGCGWVIVSRGKTYEPVNLKEFDIVLEEGKKVKFSFEEQGGASICMVGEIIRIKKIVEY